MLFAQTMLKEEELKEQSGVLASYLKGLVPGILDFAVNVLIALLIYVVGIRVIGMIRKMFHRIMERSSLDEGVKQFLESLIKVLLYFFLVVLIVARFGVTTASITAVVGSAGLAVGLAAQGSLANFAGGVLILILKPFEVGDYIVTDSGKEGTVSQIQICYTRLLSVDNQMVVIPNGKLSDGVITNVTRMDKRSVNLTVGVSYAADLKQAKACLEELLTNEPLRLPEEPIQVFVDHLGDSEVVLGYRVWVKTEDYWDVKWRLAEQTVTAFKEYHIEIPYPQMEVTINKNKNVFEGE